MIKSLRYIYSLFNKLNKGMDRGTQLSRRSFLDCFTPYDPPFDTRIMRSINKRKFLILLIPISMLVLISGCVDIPDILSPDEFKITNVWVDNGILELDIEIWARTGISTPYNILHDNGFTLLFNGQELEFWWFDMPKEFREKYEVHVEHNSLEYGLGRYDNKPLYSRGEVTSDSLPPGYWYGKARNHAYLRMYFLLENTTLNPPISIEIKNKDGKIIDSIEVKQ